MNIDQLIVYIEAKDISLNVLQARKVLRRFNGPNGELAQFPITSGIEDRLMQIINEEIIK